MIKNGIKIGLTIMGTTIGAGFASGREIWEFFTSYGLQSLVGLMITLLLLLLSSMVILWLSWRFETENYYDILVLLMGTHLAKIFDWFIFLYLFSGSIVMFAGSGAIFEQWGNSMVLGVLLLAIPLWIVLARGVRGLISLNSVLMPIKMLMMIYVGTLFLMNDQEVASHFIREHLKVWPSAITYVAFNVISLLGVLSTIGKKIRSRGEIIFGSVVGTFGLGLIAFLMNLSLLRVPNVDHYEIPLFSIIPNQPIFRVFVSIILWLAIYTTALSNVHGIIFRVQKKFPFSTGKLSFVFLTLIAPISFVGFSNLIQFLYPLYGVLNLYVLSLIILYPFQQL
ncbi:YkvI family membrane protein [Tepidibacillus fermentans]|uniref:Putative membrane protein YkvI n=1 Tax=Tepidibacillus fermentans TaxID=1281767 RepID=A0A4R3KCG5_9BACI|nr:hypothetical protein [Tepidibacillus fermentans]TCS80807.1 putative membrane protein YkvI [Tepidibacillus fermentans]